MTRWLLAAGGVAVVSLVALALAQLGSPGLPGAHGGVPPGLPDGNSLGIWEPRLLHTLGDPRTSGLAKWPGEFDAPPPVAYDFDGDGTKEVVAHGSDNKVYVFNARTGRVLATLATTLPAAWHVERVLNAPAVGVLQPGETPSIVVSNHAAIVAVWQYSPQSTADRFVFQKQWERRLTEHHKNPSMDAKPVLGDLDGDGSLEIVAQAEELGLYALTAEGETLWSLGWGGGNAAPVVEDVDGDGKPEAVFVSDGGRVHVLEGATGRARWGFDVRPYADPGSIPVSATVADLDGVAPKEVLLTARDAHAGEPERYLENHLVLLALTLPPGAYKAELLWMRQPEWANPLSYTQLVVADVDGDGSNDVLGMDWNTIGHRPGDWERLGFAHVFAFDAQGEEKWVRELDTWWSNKELALADVDDDPGLEVLASGPYAGQDGFWVLDAATGRPERFLGLGEWKADRGPFLWDLRTGSMELLVMAAPVDPASGKGGAILVFDTGRPWSAVWPGYR